MSTSVTGAPGQTRTGNLRIRSPRLYPLSYGRNWPLDGKLRTPRIDSTCGKRRIFMRGHRHAPQRYLARVSLSRTRGGTVAGVAPASDEQTVAFNRRGARPGNQARRGGRPRWRDPARAHATHRDAPPLLTPDSEAWEGWTNLANKARWARCRPGMT